MQRDDQIQRKRRQLLKMFGLGGLGLGVAGRGLFPGAALAADADGAAMNDISADDIIQRTIPSSGEQIPAIGLGTARTMDAGTIDTIGTGKLKELTRVIELFHAHGARLIDTSPMYGTAEEVVGYIVRDLGLTDEMFMATKVWTNGAENGKEQMLRSMKLLYSKPMDLMQIHNLVDWQTHYRTLRQWKDEGRIRYIGVTHYRSDVHAELARVLKSETFDFVQFNYNVLDRHAEQELLPLCQDRGIAVLINEPFEKGSLFGKTNGRELPEWMREFADSWAQVFLKFIIAHPAVTCPIPATSDPKHVVDNVMAAYGNLPDENQRRLIVEYIQGL